MHMIEATSDEIKATIQLINALSLGAVSPKLGTLLLNYRERLQKELNGGG